MLIFAHTYIFISLKHTWMMFWETKRSVNCLFFMRFWTELSCIILITVLLSFNFRRTLGNSLYCLPHRTGSFTTDLVRTCADHCVQYDNPVTIVMYHLVIWKLMNRKLLKLKEKRPNWFTLVFTGSKSALSWSLMRLKILHWRQEFHNWSPEGD